MEKKPHTLIIKPAISPRAKNRLADFLEELGYEIIASETTYDGKGGESKIEFEK